MTHPELIQAIKDKMSKYGLSKYEVAKRTGTTQSHIHAILDKGTLPRLGLFLKIAAAVGLEVSVNTKTTTDEQG